ncbi:hypothetical protein AVEN_168428-1 [Araneus ventricosus]|uniref:Uncharacterized protein n=1 Tax=Araneus ventricosus TaxID=182803 RepID=A0A4Y2JCK6_ARAVE|nr:hypothetical protein AVEN_168428-1 [Araneus ventricosus]
MATFKKRFNVHLDLLKQNWIPTHIETTGLSIESIHPPFYPFLHDTRNLLTETGRVLNKERTDVIAITDDAMRKKKKFQLHLDVFCVTNGAHIDVIR